MEESHEQEWNIHFFHSLIIDYGELGEYRVTCREASSPWVIIRHSPLYDNSYPLGSFADWVFGLALDAKTLTLIMNPFQVRSPT